MNYSALIKSFGVYSISSLLTKVVPLILLPILTKNLTTDEYGVFAAISSLIILTSSTMYFGVHYYINTEYFHTDLAKRSDLIKNIFLIPFFIFFPIIAIFYFLSLWEITFGISQKWFILIPIICIMNYPQVVLTVIYRIQKKPYHFFALELTNSLLTLSLILITVELYNQGLQGRINALTGSTLALFAIGAWILLKKKLIGIKIHTKNIKDALKFGIGIVPFEVGTHLTKLLDRLILINILGASATGIYSVGAQISSLAGIGITIFNLAWQPYLFESLKKNDHANRQILITILIFLVCYALLIGAFNILAPTIYKHFVDARYIETVNYFSLFTTGYLALFIQSIFSDFILFEKKTHLLSFTTVATLIFSVIITPPLIYKSGAIGAAYAFLITCLISMAITIFLSYKKTSILKSTTLQKTNI